jgi:hypothetical protein
MSLGLNGAFCPTSLPLFHGSRWTTLPAVPMMVSHRVEGHAGCARPPLGRLALSQARWPEPEAAGPLWSGRSISRSRPQAVLGDRPLSGFPPSPQPVEVPGRAGRSGTAVRRFQGSRVGLPLPIHAQIYRLPMTHFVRPRGCLRKWAFERWKPVMAIVRSPHNGHHSGAGPVTSNIR